MKYLKRLQALEERLNEVYQAKDHDEEYHTWIKKHPLGGVNDLTFDFNEWIEGMPPHLIAHFQGQIKLMFPFLAMTFCISPLK